MAYLYDKLKEALGGAKFSNSHVGAVRDWTPNGVKAIVIYREFILVANHVKPPRLYPLDINEVVQDLQRNGSTGALHNLLSQRQLSCMEEFYVDGMFQNYKGVLDLQGYVSKLLNDKSRLRYYGYIDGVNGQDLYKRYADAKMANNAIYSYAGDTTRQGSLQFTDVGNKTWYKNYNLRPQHYVLDADNGTLARWFRKCELDIQKQLDSLVEQQAKQGRDQAILAIISKDLENLQAFMMLYELKMVLDKSSSRWKVNKARLRMLSAIKNILQNSNGERLSFKEATDQALSDFLSGKSSGKSLSVKEVSEVCSKSGISNKTLVSAYSKCHCLSNGNEDGYSLDDLVAIVKYGDGLLKVRTKLDSICLKFTESMKDSKISYFQVVSSYEQFKDSIPEGKFSKCIGGNATETGDVMGYINFMLDVCGWSLTSFQEEYIRTTQSKGGN